MTTIEKSDPRLTAYALGELEGDEAAAVAAAVAADPALAAEVQAIRAFGAVLGAELLAEPALALAPEARAAILTGGRVAANDDAGAGRPRRAWRGWLAAGLLAAAGVVAVVGLSAREGAAPGSDPALARGETAAPGAAEVKARDEAGAPAAPRAASSVATADAPAGQGEAASVSGPKVGATSTTTPPTDGTEMPRPEGRPNAVAPAEPSVREVAPDEELGAREFKVAKEDSAPDADWMARRPKDSGRVAAGTLGDMSGAGAGASGHPGVPEAEPAGSGGVAAERAARAAFDGADRARATGTKGTSRSGGTVDALAAGGAPAVTAAPMASGEVSALDDPTRPTRPTRPTGSGDAGPSVGRGTLGHAGLGKSASQPMYRGVNGALVARPRLTQVTVQLPDGTLIQRWLPYDQVPYPDYRYEYVYDPYYYPVLPLPSTESYAPTYEAPFKSVANAPLSTFSTDVDTASYSNVRRLLESWQRPPVDAVRLEELVNAFTYATPVVDDGEPLAVAAEVTACPWAPTHRLVRVALAAREVPQGQRPAGNLVFLVDTSGSMAAANKLPLLKQALRELVAQLDERDTVAIVTYAGHAGVALQPTNGSDKPALMAAIGRLRSAGMTNGSAGLQLAYQLARQQYVEGGVNRVLLATDGDFNAGMTNQTQLNRLVQQEAMGHIYLTVLGLGTGNLKDDRLEAISNHGDGTYAYLSDIREARRVLVEQLSATLVTVAKDVKLQVEWNPARVSAYRLLGYENRALANRDFDDDSKDAGDLGAGTRVTALYEVVPVGAPRVARPVVPTGLKYQPAQPAAVVPEMLALPPALESDASAELMTVKVRYKGPEGGASELVEVPLVDEGQGFEAASSDLRWAASAASFAMLLRGSYYRGASTWDTALDLALGALGDDVRGERSEFVRLIERARRLYTGR